MEKAVIKFESPTTCILAGSTGSGKSTFLFELLKCADVIFEIPPKRIFYCYGIYQNLYDRMKKDISNIEFFNGLPLLENLENWAVNNAHNIIVLDDLMGRASESTNIADLFTQYSHHLNFTVFFITQNVYSSGKQFRTISLNSHYFILFKNQRDKMQIQTFGKQLFLGELEYFMDAYTRAVNRKYGYLVIDISPHSNPLYKLRTDILPDQTTVVYRPIKNKI